MTTATSDPVAPAATPPAADPATPPAATPPAATPPAAPAATDPTKTGDKPGGEPKGQEPTKAKADDWKPGYTMPEGAIVDPDLVESFNALARDKGFDADTQQAIVNAQLESVTRAQAAFAAVQKAWADDTIGRFKARGVDPAAAANEVAAFLAENERGQKLKGLLDETGIGSNPDLVEFLYDLRMQTREDRTPRADAPQRPNAPMRPADRIFGASKPTE